MIGMRTSIIVSWWGSNLPENSEDNSKLEKPFQIKCIRDNKHNSFFIISSVLYKHFLKLFKQSNFNECLDA